MAVKLTYTKGGIKRSGYFNSYYEAVVKKNKLTKEGIAVKFEDTNSNPPRVITSRDLKKNGKKLIENFIRRAKIPHTKQTIKELYGEQENNY